MQNRLYMELVGSLSEEGFSLDELVVKVKDLFETEGMAGIVGLLLSLFDEHLCAGLVCGEAVWQPEPCCETPRYELHKRSKRQFRTTIGTIRIEWRRLRCVHCGRTMIPLR
ncbi:MAG TPA: hypothetical protein ENH11_03835, partial [Candidatus Acetothermia bacterium]|nr:hypothetical protein [Candidatus Acetothermia bacterium]